jgi:hypothetical protein
MKHRCAHGCVKLRLLVVFLRVLQLLLLAPGAQTSVCTTCVVHACTACTPVGAAAAAAVAAAAFMLLFALLLLPDACVYVGAVLGYVAAEVLDTSSCCYCRFWCPCVHCCRDGHLAGEWLNVFSCCCCCRCRCRCHFRYFSQVPLCTWVPCCST